MSSLVSDNQAVAHPQLEDDPMAEPEEEEEEEGEGDATMGGISDDSSEEPEEDEDEARRIREGFYCS
jgi:transcription elongation factor SPT6